MAWPTSELATHFHYLMKKEMGKDLLLLPLPPLLIEKEKKKEKKEKEKGS